MRKYLIVAFAALTAMAFTTVALAQTPAATMTVKVKPKKAGTKKKPKNSSIELNIKNNDPKRTLSKLTIVSPKTFKLSAKGLTKCSQAALEANGPAACPRASKIGGGTATALVGVNSTTTAPTPLTFDVTAFVLGPKKLGFFLSGRELPIQVLSPGTLKGNKLIISVPETAQQPATGTYAGLKTIHTTLKGKKGKHYLASTVGCKSKKHAFKTVLHFINNTVSPEGDVTVKDASKCSK